MEAVHNGHYRGLAARVEWVTGFEVSLEINWDSFKGEAYSTFTNGFFDPLMRALQEIGRDRLDPLEGKLKRIIFRDSGDRICTFKDGVLTIDDSGSHPLNESSDRIKKALGF